MHRVLTVIAMTGMIFVAAHALAGNSTSQAAVNRRQVAECMSKRMSADKAISYNQAAKVCKDQAKKQNGQLALSTPPSK